MFDIGDTVICIDDDIIDNNLSLCRNPVVKGQRYIVTGINPKGSRYGLGIMARDCITVGVVGTDLYFSIIGKNEVVLEAKAFRKPRALQINDAMKSLIELTSKSGSKVDA
jgi:hypothetical protein